METREELSTKLEEEKIQYPKLQKEVVVVQQELQVAEASLEVLAKEFAEKTQTLRLEKELKQKELIPFRKQVNAVQADLDLAHSEINIFKNKTLQAKKQVELLHS